MWVRHPSDAGAAHVYAADVSATGNQSRYGWARFVRTVDQVLPKRGATLELPLVPEGSGD